MIAAGLAVARRDGFEHLTARRVADQLGASTAPVYSNFPAMDALLEAVKQAAVRELLQMTRRRTTASAFLDMGIGVLTFAWEWPRLYAGLFLVPAVGYDPGVDLLDALTRDVTNLPELSPLPAFERKVVLKKAAVFTHGLATSVCQGVHEACTLEVLVLLLQELGRAVVADARLQPPRSAGHEAMLAALWGDAALSTEPRSTNR